MSTHPDRQFPEQYRIGEDNICPVTHKLCDDECCPPGAICNLSGRGNIEYGPPPRESIHCPETGNHCTDHKCSESYCLRDCHPKERETWEHHIISKQLRIIDRLTHEKECPTHQRVKQVLVTNFQNNKAIIMSLSIVSNQSAPIVLGLIDADTLLPITATFAGESETSDNPAAATTDPKLGLVGVAPGSGNLTSVATWTYTDSKTNQLVTAQKTTVTPFTVSAVVTAENVTMTVTLGTPVTQPAAPVTP